MFRTNDNKDRVNYCDLLLPPEGYVLEKAVGTTYSLDLEALTAIAITLGLKEDTESGLLQNPISMLNALQKVSDKTMIFCEAGQIKLPGNPSPLNILLEKMVIPIALPKTKGMNTYPAFHPKTWILQYTNSEGMKKYRFAVLSRNMTFDRSWDISLCIDSSDDVNQKEKTVPIIDFLSFLRGQIKNTVQDAGKKRNAVRALMKDLENVSFSLEDREFGEEFQIMPLGIGSSAYQMSKDPLFCKNEWSSDYTFNDLVVFSPFLSASIIEHWNKKEHYITGTKRTLITRKSELSKLQPDQVNRFKIYALKDDIVDGEDQISDEQEDKQKQDIHAKIYLRRKYAETSLYLGSMNASFAAVNKNVEMMICLKTKNRYYNGDSFLKDIFCGVPDNPANPFEEVSIENTKPDEGEDEGKVLEKVIKDICRLKMKASVVFNGEKYDVNVSVDGEIRDDWKKVRIAPLRRKVMMEFEKDMTFTGLDMLQLTEFYHIQVAGEHETVSRIIMIPTTGFPDNRESAVVNSVVKDKRSFVEYVAFVLGEDYLLTMLEDKKLQRSGLAGKEVQQLPALYEKMLKTALEEPERLKEIDYLLKMITNTDIIPDEFRELYETFKTTLRLK
nr:phospholipase D family protein [Frisingicoccus sp.]